MGHKVTHKTVAWEKKNIRELFQFLVNFILKTTLLIRNATDDHCRKLGKYM